MQTLIIKGQHALCTLPNLNINRVIQHPLDTSPY